MMRETDRPDVTVSPKQLVFLTMIAVMAAVVVFLCGVQVGRGVATWEAGAGGSTAAGPTADGAAVLDGPAQAPEPDGPAGSRLDGLSYFGRLRGSEPVPETLDFAGERQAAGGAEPGPSDPPAGGPGGSFVVQVMSVRGGAAAQDVKADLEAKGYPVVIDPTPGTPGGLHRVRLGPYADRAEAERASHRLRTEERFEPRVTEP
jgi:DedD protein